MFTSQELLKFENDVAESYKQGKIRGPIHLRDGNAEYLVELFQEIKHEDYCFCTWASHFHCLLKGTKIPWIDESGTNLPKEIVKDRVIDMVWKDIHKGKSITLNYPIMKLYSSAIVGGIAPIATGTAFSLKKKKSNNRVWCFLGDMALHNGSVLDSIQYSIVDDLPITWVVEDNGKSVATPTEEVCIPTKDLLDKFKELSHKCVNTRFLYYKFEQVWPHNGIGFKVGF